VAAPRPELLLSRLRALARTLRESEGREAIQTALEHAFAALSPTVTVILPGADLPDSATATRTVSDGERTLVPILRYGSQPIGALVLPAGAPAPLVEALETAAELAASRLGQLDLQATVLRRSLELALLNDLSRSLNAAESADAAVGLAAAGLSELTGPVDLALYQLREGVPALVSWTGPAEAFPVTVRILDGAGNTILGAGRATGLRTGPGSLADRPALVHVLRAGERMVGVLVIRRGVDGPPFPEDQSALALALVEHLAIALHNVEMLAWSRHQAAFDDLTGLAARRHFLSELRREVARVRRQGTPMSMLMVDADHFKNINDTWGHAAGDAVLIALAETLKEGTRTLDVVGRLGGEEFGVLLPSADIDAAQMVAERLRAMTDALRVPYGDHVIQLTVSIGVAEWGPELSLEDLVELADAALYRSKAAGRNMVTIASALATIDEA
jgi:diguanylate cyclase (GGDEF)-like protein